MTEGDPAAALTATLAARLTAARSSLAVAWHALTEASCNHAIAHAGGESDVHALERLDAQLRAAAVVYAAAVEAAHEAAQPFRAPAVSRRRRR